LTLVASQVSSKWSAVYFKLETDKAIAVSVLVQCTFHKSAKGFNAVELQSARTGAFCPGTNEEARANIDNSVLANHW
jgi:hypothetical protein